MLLNSFVWSNMLQLIGLLNVSFTDNSIISLSEKPKNKSTLWDTKNKWELNQNYYNLNKLYTFSKQNDDNSKQTNSNQVC